MCEVVGVTFIFHCEQNVFVFFLWLFVCACKGGWVCTELAEVLSSSSSLPPPPALVCD